MSDRTLHLDFVVVTYNSDVGLLRDCLESVSSQASQASVSVGVRVVDNASIKTDHLSLLEELGVSFQVLNQNVGFGAAVNHAISSSKADWVFLLNPDAKLARGAMTAIERTITASSGDAIYAGLLTSPRGIQLDAYWLWWTSWQHFRGRGRPERCQLEGAEVMPIDKVCGGALLASRKILRKMGPFDESFFLYCEDADLSLRAREARVDLLLVPDIAVTHAAAASMRDSAPLVEAARADSTIRLALKHRGFLFSLYVRADLLASTIVGLPLSRSSASFGSRLSRLWSLQRWGLRRQLPPFSPDEWASSRRGGA